MTKKQDKRESFAPIEAPVEDMPADQVGFDMSADHTPDEWMVVLGKYALGPRCGVLKRRKLPLWQHAAADALHGWSQHKHDMNEPFRLSRDAYLGALAVVDPQPPEGGKHKAGRLYRPHGPALTPRRKLTE